MHSGQLASASEVNANVSVRYPSSSMARIAPIMSGRWAENRPAYWFACSAVAWVRPLSRTLPWMTCTNLASSEPPRPSTMTSGQSRKTTGPVKWLFICCHQACCPGRAALRWAASADSNRTTAINVPSPVMARSGR